MCEYQDLTRSVYIEKGQHPCIAIVIGWYPLSVFKTKIDSSLYNVAGNLFSKLGVNPMLRNLMHNNHIKHLLFLNATQEDALVKSNDFAVSILKGEIPLTEINTVESLFSTEAFHLTQSGINSQVCTTIDDLRTQLLLLKDDDADFSRPQYTYPLETKRIDIDVLPNPELGHVIRANTINIAQIEALKRIRENGLFTSNLQEILNLVVTIAPDDSVNFYDFLESQPLEMRQYINNFLCGTNSTENYGYGDRLLTKHGNQVKEIVFKLKRKTNTLAALLQIWDAEDLVNGNSPCLTQIWCRNRDNRLHMLATFRSNDMYKAWKTNISALKALQYQICDELGIKAGTLSTSSFSAHVYQDDITNIDRLLKKEERGSGRTVKFFSHCGNFILSVTEEGIFVTQTDNKEREVAKYVGKDSTLIMKKILDRNPTIEPGHVAYLSKELELCRICFYRGIPYKQGETKLNNLLRTGMI